MEIGLRKLLSNIFVKEEYQQFPLKNNNFKPLHNIRWNRITNLGTEKSSQLTIAIRLCQRTQPAANSLQANTLGEFAGTAYSQPLSASK